MLFLPYFELKMINFFGYSIESWKTFWFLGRVAVIYVMLKEAERLKLNKKTVIIIFLLGLIFISFFEKLLFYLSHQFLHNDGAMIHFSYAGWGSLGRVFFGVFIGIILAVLIGALITRQLKNFWSFLDLNLIAQIVGSFFYRIGNLLNHSHMGNETNFFLGIPFQGKIRHEVTLYELISLGLLFLIVWPLRKKIKKPGFLSLIILGWMSLSRFITDFFRSADLPYSNFHFSNGLTLNQVAYGILFGGCLIAVSIIISKHGRKIFIEKNSTPI